jgi:hypothetical protein
MEAKLEAMETGKSRVTPFLLTKSESNANLSHHTQSTDPTNVEYSSHSSEGEVTTEKVDERLNSLLDDDEAYQTRNSVLGDDEDFLQAGREDSPPRQVFLHTRVDNEIPSEIIVIQEPTIPSFHERSIDVFSRLQETELLVQSYKEKVLSTESYGDSLHKYLKKTQFYAEELLSENHGLRKLIAEMEREQVIRSDEDLLYKTLFGACFALYMFGGSEYYLAAPVGLYLFFGFFSFFL